MVTGAVMGRKPRVEFKGAIYHVIKRGNNREKSLRKKLQCLKSFSA
jgi:hypothetical protein